MLCRARSAAQVSIAAKNSTPERFGKHYFVPVVCANAFFFSVCATMWR
jgi:hypothetical protein